MPQQCSCAAQYLQLMLFIGCHVMDIRVGDIETMGACYSFEVMTLIGMLLDCGVRMREG